MVRVLQMLGTLDCGGQESFVMNVYRNINREKVQFDFIVSNVNNDAYFYESEAEKLGANIFRVNLKSKRPIKSFFQIIKIVKKGNYKIVHKHSNISLMGIDLLAAKFGGAKILISHSHSTKLDVKYKEYINKLFIPFLNKISTDKLACSYKAGLWLYGKNNFKVINNGIEIEKFIYSEKIRLDIRNELHIDNKFVIGHIGRFTYAKNHMFLLEIIYELKKINSNTLLILIGEGELRNEIQLKIKELSLEDNVMILGLQRDVGKIMQGFDVFVFPSFYEGLPLTVIEAQAAGLPCVISNTITNEVCITKLIKRIPLSKMANQWAKEVIDLYNTTQRENQYETLKKSNYNIKKVANGLEKFYLSFNSFK
ncbi:MAG: glycosyltransferase family 1 protein [Clostridium sp.]|nr:glycosyltransferase family 1 protein [Clostridium sp.]